MTEADSIPEDLNENDESEAGTTALVVGIYQQLGWAIGSIILAMLVAALIMIASGYNPLLAYGAMMRGALINVDQIFWRATPLIVTGLSVALAFKSGLFNIGAEGQLYIGAMAAAIVGFAISLPIVVHPILCLLIGAICGGLWGFVPGLLKAYRGAHEVVTTMMLSYTAILFTQWLAAGPLRDPFNPQPIAETVLLYDSARLPLVGFSEFLHFGFFLAILLVIGVFFLLQYTVFGYEMRAVGLNESAAEAGGIKPKRMIAFTLGISGGLAGIAGAAEVMGTFYRFIDGFSPGYGFDGITVAVLGNNSPFGVLGGAIFFGFLRAGSFSMQVQARVPAEMINVIQGLIVLFVAAPQIISWLANRGVTYARWIQKDSKVALPLFITAIFSLVSCFIGFGVGFANLPINPLITLSLVAIGAISLGAFIGLFAKYEWSPIVSIISLFLWIPVGIINFLFHTGTLLIPFLVLGIVGGIFSVWSFYLTRWKGIEIGGGC